VIKYIRTRYFLDIKFFLYTIQKNGFKCDLKIVYFLFFIGFLFIFIVIKIVKMCRCFFYNFDRRKTPQRKIQNTDDRRKSKRFIAQKGGVLADVQPIICVDRFDLLQSVEFKVFRKSKIDRYHNTFFRFFSLKI